MNEDSLRIFDLLRTMQKELSDCEGSLKSHLESSIVRVDGYDKDINSIKTRLQKVEESLKEIQVFVVDYNGQKKGIEQLKSLFTYIIGAIATILGIIGFYLSVKK